MNPCNICTENRTNFVKCGGCNNAICVYCFSKIIYCPYCRQLLNVLNQTENQGTTSTEVRAEIEEDEIDEDLDIASDGEGGMEVYDNNRLIRRYTPEQTRRYNQRRQRYNRRTNQGTRRR